MLESAVNRRLAVIALCLVATVSYVSVLVNAQLCQHCVGGVTGSAYSTTWSLFGWPTVYCQRSTAIALPWLRVVETMDSWSLAHLSVNAVVILVLGSAVGTVMWRLIHFCRHRRSVSIAFLFGLMTSVGAVFPLYGALDGLARLQLNKSDWPSPADTTWPLLVTAWFGLFCFAHTAIATVWCCARSVVMSREHN